MKRRILIKELARLGAELLRHGSNHDIYSDGNNFASVPRHREVDEQLAKEIIKCFSSTP